MNSLNIVKHVESSFENPYTIWWCIFKATGETLRRGYVTSLNKLSRHCRESSSKQCQYRKATKQRTVSMQFNCIKANFLRLGSTYVGILGREMWRYVLFKTCRSVVGPKSKCSSMSPASCLKKENNFKLNGVVFELILANSFPKDCHFNHYLAKQSFELTKLSRWLHHLSWTVVTNFFPSAGFKIWNIVNNPVQMCCFVPKLGL